MLADNIKSTLYLHIIVFIWGFTAILGQLITLEALPLVWYRIAIAIVSLLVIFIVRKQSIKVNRVNKIKFLAAGIVIALHWLCFFWAIKVSNISVTLACLSTGAFFASILEPIFYKRKFVLYEMGLGSVVIVALGIIFSVEGQYISGILLGLTAAVLSAMFSIINGKLVQHSAALIITFYEMVGGFIFLSLFLLISGGFTPSFFEISITDWGWLLLLGTVCTALAFIGSVYVMKHLTPYTVMLTINLEPVYGIVLAVLIFKDAEKMTVGFYIGALLILSTVVANAIIKRRKTVKLK
ncbi:MAG: DMT family transporter [Flavobacteriaceae bacterium]|jgi:drug/metabolite transporter (DMT)-like permease|nr:DMT family transporter [Flavobacteriaceae bacterium]